MRSPGFSSSSRVASATESPVGVAIILGYLEDTTTSTASLTPGPSTVYLLLSLCLVEIFDAVFMTIRHPAFC